MIEDIEDETLCNARFKKPIVPVVCKHPIIPVRIIPPTIDCLYVGTTCLYPFNMVALINISNPAAKNRHPPIKKGGMCSFAIRYFPVGNDDPIHMVANITLGRKPVL